MHGVVSWLPLPPLQMGAYFSSAQKHYLLSLSSPPSPNTTLSHTRDSHADVLVLQAGAWCPQMQPYIHGVRAGMHIIDLDQTAKQLRRALEVVRYAVCPHIAPGYRHCTVLSCRMLHTWQTSAYKSGLGGGKGGRGKVRLRMKRSTAHYLWQGCCQGQRCHPICRYAGGGKLSLPRSLPPPLPPPLPLSPLSHKRNAR